VSDERHMDSPDPELEQALSGLEAPRARAAFKEALREQFVTGDFGAARTTSSLEPDSLEPDSLEPDSLELDAPVEDASAPRPAMAVRLRNWGVIGLVAATIALLVVVRPWEPGEPTIELPVESVAQGGAAQALDPAPWHVVGARAGAVRVDGVEFALADAADPEALDHALSHGRVVEVLEGDLRLRLGSSLLIEATEASEFSLTEKACSADLTLAVERGVLRVCTGPEFPGTTLALRTPDVELSVTGTAFAIDLYDKGTCICCTDGTVNVEPLDMPCSHSVSAGTMVFASRDRLVPCATGDVMEPHAEPLRALEDFAATIW